MKSLTFIGIWLISFLFNIPAYISQQKAILADRTVYYWQPAKSEDVSIKKPVIFFSHGFGGCGRQSTHIMNALAQHGYWVFSPNHKDAKCGIKKTPWISQNNSFNKPQAWSDQSFTDRRDDIVEIISALKLNAEFSAFIDFNRLGLMGHSLGGYTVLGLGGAWKNWQIPNIKGIVAMSPYSEPYNIKASLRELSAPVMYQGGTEDFAITLRLKGVTGSYQQSPAPKFFVEFDGLGHLGWTDLRTPQQDDVISYTLAFLDYYVKGDKKINEDCQKVQPICILKTKSSRIKYFSYNADFGKN